MELVREWKFLAPSAEVSRPLYALRKNSTKFDVVIPSTLPSRASTPTAQFQEVVKKVATAAPPEFNMDSFAF